MLTFKIYQLFITLFIFNSGFEVTNLFKSTRLTLLELRFFY